MTKGEFLDLFDDLHDDTIICIATDEGPRHVGSVFEEMVATGPSEVSAVIVLAPEVSQ